MSSKDKNEETPMDVRAIERARKRGIMSAKEAEKLQKGLPDAKGKAVSLGDINAVNRGDDSFVPPEPAAVAAPAIDDDSDVS